MKKIIFAGGGTGGHLYSGIALADQLRHDDPYIQVLFVGTILGLEKKIVPECGYALEFLPAAPLKGSGLKLRLTSLFRLPKAYLQAKKILKRFCPDLVVGIGGYASGPMVLAAHFQKIVTAIIEQNAYPGFTNRKLARFVDLIFISFKKAAEFFPKKKTYLTGNPVRNFSQIVQGSRPSQPFTLFILGGSQGAHTLNQAMTEALPLLKEFSQQFRWIHQTGDQDFVQVKAAYEKHKMNAEVFTFSQNVGAYYHQAHLVLCRAGAGTITELRIQGRAAILVPYPYATDDHQLYNAAELVEAGAAELKLNQELNGPWIAERLLYYLENPQVLETMELKAASGAKPKASQEVLEHCLKVWKTKK